MPRPGHQIYEEEMILKGHGFPVWFGDPYGRAEIKIGDIGYMSEGMFVHVMKCTGFNFNESITTPVDFKGPIYSHSLEQREVGAEAKVSASQGVGVESQISLTSSRNTCAMLNVEEGVADYTRCSDVDKQAVGEIFLKNARQWIAEAVRGHQIASDISIERLILVTGFYKSANWEAAVLYSSSSTGNLSFTIGTTQAGGGILVHWDSVQHLSPDYSTGHRHPPQTDLNEPPVLGARGDITHGTNSPAEPHVLSFEKCCRQHADRTQCIFLRGFRIRGRLVQKDRVIELLALEESKLSWRERFMRLLNSKTSKPPGGESSQRSASAYDNLEAIEGFPDTNFCDQLYGTIAVKKFMENASSFVLVHDDELIGILERDAAALDYEPGSSLLSKPSLPLYRGRVGLLYDQAGVKIETLSPGDGKTYPKKGDKVTIHYVGTLQDGSVFDSSQDRGAPFETEIGVGKVIKGWDEGIPQLSLGQKAVLTISPEYGYGSRGFPPVIPPNSVLIFEVELLKISK